MTKRDKIIACCGHVKNKSIAVMVGTSRKYVNNVVAEVRDSKKW